MKGLFIPDITAEMFRNGCFESIEVLMAEGEIYDIEYPSAQLEREPMGEMMTFPDTWEEYEEFYGFNDNKEIYTNGSRLIPSFRVKQWLDHIASAQPERKTGKWIPDEIAAYDMPKGEPRGWVPWLCSECGWCVGKHQTAFCPSCGADMRQMENRNV